MRSSFIHFLGPYDHTLHCRIRPIKDIQFEFAYFVSQVGLPFKEKGTSWTLLNDTYVLRNRYLQKNICYCRSSISPQLQWNWQFIESWILVGFLADQRPSWPSLSTKQLTTLTRDQADQADQADQRPSISTFKQLAQESSINQLIIGTQLWILTMSMKMMMMNRKMMKVMTKGWCGAVCSSDHAIIRRQPGQEGVRWQRSLPCHPPPLPPFPCHPILKSPNPLPLLLEHGPTSRSLSFGSLDCGRTLEMSSQRWEMESSVFVNDWFSVFVYFEFLYLCISNKLFHKQKKEWEK